MDSKLTVISWNAANSEKAAIELEKQSSNQIYLLQEPKVINGVVHPKLSNYDTYSFKSKDKPRAAILVPKSVKFLYNSKLSNKDNVAGLLECDDGTKILLASTYLENNINKTPGELNNTLNHTINPCVCLARAKNFSFICGADVNSKSLRFSPTEDSRGAILDEFLLNNNLFTANTISIPTYIGGNSKTGTFIDAIISNAKGSELISDFFVDEDNRESDHRQLHFTIGKMSKVILKTRNLTNVNWPLFQRKLQKFRYTESNFYNKAKLDYEFDQIIGNINDALDSVCPLRTTTRKKQNHWWNGKLNLLRTKVRSAAKDSRRDPSEINKVKYKELRDSYNKEIRKAKTNEWKKFIETINDVKSMSKMSKILSSEKSNKLGQVKLNETSTEFTSSTEETIHVFADRHFPESIEATEESEVEVGEEEWISIKHIQDNLVTKELVKMVFKSFGKHKAAGPHGIKPIVLQNLTEPLYNKITTLYSASLQLKYVPKSLCSSKVVFIHKNNKPTDCASGYRPISLSSFLLKGLEKIVLWDFNEKLVNKPYHRNQHAFTKSKSCDTALSAVVNQAERGILQGEYCIGVFLDVKAAFDRIKPSYIISRMEERFENKIATSWYNNLLSNRTTEIEINGQTVKRKLTLGVAQGGILSPMAWNISIDTLLNNLNDGGPVTCIGFADDVCLLINGINIDTMLSQLQRSVKKAENWAREAGLEFGAAKSKYVVFTNKRRKDSDTTVQLKIANSPIQEVDDIKYLGINLNCKLSWNNHIDSKVKKAKQHMFILRKLIHCKLGPNPGIMKWAYESIVRPALTYGCHVWGANLNKTQTQKLKKVNRLGLLLIAPAWRSAPTNGLEIIYDVSPLDLHIKHLATMTRWRTANQLKMNWAKTTSNKMMPHILVWDMELKKQNITPKPNQIQFRNVNSNFSIPKFSNTENNSDESKCVWYVYTDGSHIDHKTGSAYILMKNGKQIAKKMYKLNDLNSVYQAELVAIRQASRNLAHFKNTKIVFRVDSQAALSSLQSDLITDILVKETIDSLNALGKNNKLRLQWIKAHAGHPGNEAADIAAKEASLSGAALSIALPNALTKLQIKNFFRHKWKIRWQFTEKGDYLETKDWFAGPCNKISKILKYHDRKTIGKLVAFLTGHCNLNHHLNRTRNLENRTNLEEEALCRFCRLQSERPRHLVTNCPSLIDLRAEVYNIRIMETIPELKTNQLLAFVKQPIIWTALDYIGN